ncbi:hypothetical protein [Neobacillus drentensis]|uniref:hypothetical protein n=1 Tax=Neobacillus drentensis TaxID=220684 RepID=UPI0028652491|nr:hypothetical protein [Neobacillus drentensis]MDR7237314.1 hypothetical protein [Neobacillus drentensis]
MKNILNGLFIIFSLFTFVLFLQPILLPTWLDSVLVTCYGVCETTEYNGYHLSDIVSTITLILFIISCLLFIFVKRLPVKKSIIFLIIFSAVYIYVHIAEPTPRFVNDAMPQQNFQPDVIAPIDDQN